MKCPTCGAELVRPTRDAFRATVELPGVTYRAKDCRSCLHTFLTAELVLDGDAATRLEELLDRTSTLDDTLQSLATLTAGIAEPAL